MGDSCTTGGLWPPTIQFQFDSQKIAYIGWQYQYLYQDTLNLLKPYFYISDYIGRVRMVQQFRSRSRSRRSTVLLERKELSKYIQICYLVISFFTYLQESMACDSPVACCVYRQGSVLIQEIHVGSKNPNLRLHAIFS